MKYQELINKGIKRLRIQQNITQEKFAEAIGMSVQGLRNLEQNKYQPTSDTIDTICNTFNINPIYLLLPDISEDKLQIKSTIMSKLDICNRENLQRINEIIDIVIKKY